MHLSTTELAVRLLLATALGAAVGFERESASRGAGSRTHALVALGAALFTIAGAYGFGDYPRSPNVDPARVAAQVAAGVGFIGAGAIIRNGASVLGVTTAATVWLSASIGVTVAAGGYAAGAMGGVLALLVLVLLRVTKPLARRVGRHRTIVQLEYDRGHGTIGPLLRALQELDARMENLSVEDDDVDALAGGTRKLTVAVTVRNLDDLDRILEKVGSRPEVRTVSVAEGESA